MTTNSVDEDCPSVPVLIAIGANIGNPEAKIQEAFQELNRLSSSGYKQSSLWRTVPVSCPEGSPDYLNAAVSITVKKETHPESFLEQLLNLEASLGRQRFGTQNEPRIIDLDLICYGSTQFQGSDLILPHPRAHERRFVLAPLAEIEPDFVIPGLDKTVVQLLNLLPADTECSRLICSNDDTLN